MSSPAKKRKKNPPPTPHKGKTLDHFFGAKATAKAVPSDEKTAELDAKPNGLTDEEYARKLAAEWARQDKNATAKFGSSSSSAGSNLRRGSYQERMDFELAKRMTEEDDGAREEDERGRPIKKRARTPEQTPDLKSQPATPKKVEVSLQTEEEIIKTIESIRMDSNPVDFDPDSYQSLASNWPNGNATYNLLTRAFVLVNSTRSRIKIVDTLVNLLRLLIRLDPSSLLPAVWLTTNDIGPPYENNDLGIGPSIITKAIARTSGITPAALKKLYHKYGDAGDVAFDARSKQKTLMMRKPTPLTITNVYKTLLKIAASSGKGSQDAKETLVKRLLVDAKGEETRYLVRTFVQHLRIGAVKTTMLIALARAFTLSSPSSCAWSCPSIPKDKGARQEVFSKAEEVLKQCFARRPNYNDIVPSLLSGGVSALEKECGMALHVPLMPMLGSITRDLSEMLQKLQGRSFTCEYKYDGQRAQIHCDATGTVTVFSRHLELMTEKYPDLVELVPKIRGEGVRDFIIEGEVVAVDASTGDLKPFQTLAGRERKNVEIANISVTVCLFAFDLMYLNGVELLSRPLRERRELLLTKFIELPGHFTWVKSIDADSTDESKIREFFASALNFRCEGIMTKVLDNPLSPSPPQRHKPLLATYEPNKRLDSWLKVKKDYTASSPLTLDLVPIGAWHGNGRKHQWWSPILLAVRNPATGSLEAVCKCMSGFTDAFYAALSDSVVSTSRKPYFDVADSLNPAVWFEPREVWEVAFADVSVSPVYTAARGLGSEEDKGLSLRFPRFIRKRDDKSIEEASTAEELADLYWKQEQGGGTQHVVRVGVGEDEEVEAGTEEETGMEGGEQDDDAAPIEEDPMLEANQT